MNKTSFSWVRIVLDDHDLSFRAKAFAMYFGTYMNLSQDCAWPGYRRICYEMHCSPKTVKKYVDELVEYGYLTVGKQPVFGKGGEQELNKYIAQIPAKVLSMGKHLLENDPKVLPLGTKGTSVQGTKVLPQGKHNNNINNNKNNKSGKPDISSEIINYLNKKTGKNFKPVESNKKLIRARIKESYSEDDLFRVIDRKVLEWAGDSKMAQYLRPATLFNAEKFNQYYGELGTPLPEKTTKPDWAKIPYDDDDLWPWAAKHKYSNPGTMNYNQYRSRLKSEVERRLGNER